MDEVPSKYLLPSVSKRYDPLPRSMITGSSCSHSCIWVKGATDIAGPIAQRGRLLFAGHASCSAETVKKVMPENLVLVRARRGLYEGLFTLTTWEAVTIMNRFY